MQGKGFLGKLVTLFIGITIIGFFIGYNYSVKTSKNFSGSSVNTSATANMNITGKTTSTTKSGIYGNSKHTSKANR